MATQVTLNPRLTQFASDNSAGICPTAWQALQQANEGFAPAYGNCDWTQQASDAIRSLFKRPCEVFFCFNGTAANSMSLAHACRPFHAVIAHKLAHIENDECGGPEFFSHGSKLLLVDGDNGKCDPDHVIDMVKRRTDIHYPKPEVLSLTQSTEVGSVYTLKELATLGETAKQLGLWVHLDGARFANAVASADVDPSDMIDAGQVDVLCFGGTKNGMPIGEAVVFFNTELAAEFDYRCKQAGQLASKMRFLAAPWATMLQEGTWLTNAQNANHMATLLAKGFEQIPGIKLLHHPQANAVFVELHPKIEKQLREAGAQFYSFLGSGGARFMCSWATTRQDVQDLLDAASK